VSAEDLVRIAEVCGPCAEPGLRAEVSEDCANESVDCAEDSVRIAEDCGPCAEPGLRAEVSEDCANKDVD